MPFPETVEERYEREPQFKRLVDALEYYAHGLGFGAADVHDAAVLACIRHERITVRERILYVDIAGVASFSL
jgi:hypothetical protein